MMTFDEIETGPEVADSVVLFALAGGLPSEEVKHMTE
jgi:hypothetical protein